MIAPTTKRVTLSMVNSVSGLRKPISERKVIVRNMVTRVESQTRGVNGRIRPDSGNVLAFKAYKFCLNYVCMYLSLIHI